MANTHAKWSSVNVRDSQTYQYGNLWAFEVVFGDFQHEGDAALWLEHMTQYAKSSEGLELTRLKSGQLLQVGDSKEIPDGEDVVAFNSANLTKIGQALVDCQWFLGIEFGRLVSLARIPEVAQVYNEKYREQLKQIAEDPKYQDTELGVTAFDLQQVEEALDVLKTANVNIPAPHC